MATESLIYRAQELLKKREFQTAISELEANETRFRDTMPYWQLLAHAQSGLGNLDGSAAALEHALRLQPTNGDLLFNLAVTYSKGSRPEKSIPIFQNLLRVRPDMAELHYNLAISQKACGNLAESERAYRETIRLNPSLTAAYRNLGNLLIDLDRAEEAFDVYHRDFLNRRRRAIDPNDPDTRSTTPDKLRRDVEQLAFLDQNNRLEGSDRQLIESYQSVLEAIESSGARSETAISEDQLRCLGGAYQRILHLEPADRVDGGALNPEVDWQGIENGYLTGSPKVAVIDDVLTPAALEGLRRFLLLSTIWHRWRFANDNGYLGAMMDDGFDCPLILQIAEDLRAALPGLLKQHPLRKVWAFKHARAPEGVPIHADFAAVNVNLYVTHDEANLDPETGGLLVWDVAAPRDWGFEKFNTDEGALQRLVEESGASPMRFPHRQNRIVMFDSDLLHATDTMSFKDGYENRRINVTLLFGKREDRAP